MSDEERVEILRAALSSIIGRGNSHDWAPLPPVARAMVIDAAGGLAEAWPDDPLYRRYRQKWPDDL